MLHPVVEHIKAEVPGLALNAWYLDDGTLVDSPGNLDAVLHIIKIDSPLVELYLNRAKFLLFMPEEAESADASLSPLRSDIPITHGEFTMLGCTINPPPIVRRSSGGGLLR